MVTAIRLKRIGKKKDPYYRIIVTDSRNKRDGRVIEEVGKYHPTAQPSYISVDSNKILYWLSVGAQASSTVTKILQLSGDYQKFHGDKNAKSIIEGQLERIDVVKKIDAINDQAAKMKYEMEQKRQEVEKKLAEEVASKTEVTAESKNDSDDSATENNNDTSMNNDQKETE
jgi:small subunit ribosomal protein S16